MYIRITCMYAIHCMDTIRIHENGFNGKNAISYRHRDTCTICDHEKIICFFLCSGEYDEIRNRERSKRNHQNLDSELILSSSE